MIYKEALLAFAWMLYIIDLVGGPESWFVSEPMQSNYPYSFLGFAEFTYDSVGLVFLGITTLGLIVFLVLAILTLIFVYLRRRGE